MIDECSDVKYPYIYVTRRKDFPGGWEFFCSYCNTKHTHGEGLGHRVSHCTGDSPYRDTGYVITTNKELETHFTKEPRTPKKTIIYRKNKSTIKLRHLIFKKYDYRCVECGATNKDTVLHIDHIIPRAKGGGDEINNLQVLCRDCNLGKGTDIWTK